jgi:hypothetical protein
MAAVRSLIAIVATMVAPRRQARWKDRRWDHFGHNGDVRSDRTRAASNPFAKHRLHQPHAARPFRCIADDNCDKNFWRQFDVQQNSMW